MVCSHFDIVAITEVLIIQKVLQGIEKVVIREY